MTRAPMAVAIDLDGILADFTKAFARLIADELDKHLTVGPEGPLEWLWHRKQGVTEKEDEHLWAVIRESPDFWNRLTPLPHARETIMKLEQLSYQGLLDPYFITSRVGATAKAQSVAWLRRWGMVNPHVLIAKNARQKGIQALALGVRASLDDNVENVRAFAEAGAESFVLNMRYNEGVQGKHIHRVYTPMAAVVAMVVMAKQEDRWAA